MNAQPDQHTAHTLLTDIPDWFNGADPEQDSFDSAQFVTDGKTPDELALESAHLAISYESDADAIANRIKILQERKASKLRAADRLRKRAHEFMRMAGAEQLRDGVITVYTRKASKKLVVTDAELLPCEWVKIERKPLLEDMKKHWKQTGEVPPGAAVEETPESLVIRG